MKGAGSPLPPTPGPLNAPELAPVSIGQINARQRSRHHGARLGPHARSISLPLYSPLYTRGLHTVGDGIYGR